VLNKTTQGKSLSARQKKKNKQKSRIRVQVEHPFDFMNNKLMMQLVGVKTIEKNSLRFDKNCNIYNVLSVDFK
jgi:hypothetical protein